MSRAPRVHRLQVGVAGVTVANQHSGEVGQHATGVDSGRGAVPDVHQRQVLGARYVHIGQGTGGAARGLVGVQNRRAGQQFAQVGQEPLLQLAGRAAPDPGEESGGDVDAGQRFQQVAGATDQQVVRAGEQRGAAIVSGPIRTGEPGAATVPLSSSLVSQSGVVTVPQHKHRLEIRRYSMTSGGGAVRTSTTCRRSR
jgi:hypothetical protein